MRSGMGGASVMGGRLVPGLPAPGASGWHNLRITDTPIAIHVYISIVATSDCCVTMTGSFGCDQMAPEQIAVLTL